MGKRQFTLSTLRILLALGLLLLLALPAASATAQSGGTVHVVAAGETLRTIAARYGVSTDAIIAANNIVNPDRIFAGQRLTIPGSGGAAPGVGSSTTHIVQAGENLYRIGLRYGLTVDQLLAANGLSNPDQVYAGQMLTISGGNGSAAPPASAAPASAPAAASNNSTTHTVQAGETLFRIALRYNVSLSTLTTANQLGSADVIYAGQRLVIPGASTATGGGSAAPAAAPAAGSAQGKQIVVDLSEQSVYVYQDGVLLRQFLVSTGLPATPTVQGNFTIQRKYLSTRMTGPDYDLPGVPYPMYFYQGYALHGTYWHSNFGHPMSHGCVNMRTADAEWLYQFAPVGTAVRVQY
jgi:LysM repeat protein